MAEEPAGDPRRDEPLTCTTARVAVTSSSERQLLRRKPLAPAWMASRTSSLSVPTRATIPVGCSTLNRDSSPIALMTSLHDSVMSMITMGPNMARQRDRLAAAVCFAHDLDAWLPLQNRPESSTYEGLLVTHENPDGQR
jgi:hypothetical protein